MFLKPLPRTLDAIAWVAERIGTPNLKERLAFDQAGAFAVPETDCAVVLSVGVTKDTGTRALWVEALGGSAPFRPHQNLDVIRATFADCDEIAKASGCSEIRIEANNRTALKKRLFEQFGFVAEPILGSTVMRKVVI